MRTAELLDSLKQQEPISLSQILDAKEQRVCRQQEMMSRETGNSPKTLISFTLNIAGAIKSFPLFYPGICGRKAANFCANFPMQGWKSWKNGSFVEKRGTNAIGW